MVFTKLTDQQKEEIAIFKTEFGTSLTSSIRALIMRGSTFEDARDLILSREAIRAELLKDVENSNSYKDLQDVPTEIIKKTRAPRK